MLNQILNHKTSNVGKKASYEIIAMNTGDILLDDLVVKNVVPSGNKLLVAPDAAAIEDNIITWTSSLSAGESKSFEITVLGIERGNCGRWIILI